MRKLILSLAVMMALTGCSLQDVSVENSDSSSQEANNVNEADDSDGTAEESGNSDDAEDIQLNIRPEISERFLAQYIVESGGYLTVDSAEIFDNLNDAGIEESQLEPNSLLLSNGEVYERYNEITQEGAAPYDKSTGDMINGWRIAKIHFTFENESAITLVNDSVATPEGEEYADDIFSVGYLNLCNTDNNYLITEMNYLCYTRIYFSLEGSVDYLSETDNCLFQCPAGEKVEFDLAYIFCCDPEYLYLSTSSGCKSEVMVDLKLGGDS
ncbi:MAG: hypothetical protein LUG26_00650 [Ruminococcus sp.]|nr:hypothetical protein [Ruminococcus sp.]